MSGAESNGRTEQQVLAAVGRLLARAEAVGFVPFDEPRPWPTPVAVSVLQDLARAADGRLRAGPGDSEAGAIAVHALDLERELRRHVEVRRARRRAEPEDGIDRLLPVADPATLLRRVADEAVRGCGVRRALFSRVGDGVWAPLAWSEGAGRTADGDGALPLDTVALERQVVRTRRPVLVADAATDDRVHPAVRAMMATSFAVVPVAPGDLVIGLLHVDRRGDDRPLDGDDRDLAWAFAEGFGRLYERAALRSRLAAQRAIVEATARAALNAVPELSDTIELARTVDLRYRERDPLESRPIADALLTPREREVADLMAAGLTNAAIGRRLVVEPATVKSHVRIILRKLGAANRAQAVALCLRRSAAATDVPRAR